MSKTTPIQIDLTKPLAARRVGADELIQRDALQAISSIVKRQLKDVPPRPGSGPVDNDYAIDRRHNAITVAGGRGTGKTTFMLSLRRLLEKELAEQLVWLRPIDPTLIESREHIFVNVLAEMWLQVNRAATVDRKSANYKQWSERYLSGLAEGLQMLEGGAAGSSRDADWQSPQYSMDLGISRANSSAKLEWRFHEFIEKTLVLLDKKAFVVTLDDIDTQFERGWTVMEVVRKYLTSPSLIVLVLGDMHLYSLLVRRQMWSMMTGTVPVERLGEQELAEAIHRLESQYLEKIFKVQNRVKLQTLDEVLTHHDVEVVSREQPRDTAHDLKDLIKAFCRCGLALKDDRDIANVLHLLLRQPVRTVLHLLTGPMYKWVEPDRSVQDRDVREMLDLLAETCLGALYQHGVRVDDLRSATADNVMDLAIDFLRTADLWHDGYRLKPEFRDDSKNLALLALGSRITHFLKTSPHLLGDYVIRVGITREAGMMKDTSRYLQFVGLETTKSLPTIARRAIGYLRADLQGRADKYGPTLGAVATVTHVTTNEMKAYVGPLATSPKDRSHYSVYLAGIGAGAPLPAKVNTIGSVQRRLRGFGSTMAALPALRLTDAAGRSTSYLSIFPLIAIVSELLDPNVSNRYDALRRWGQLRSFPLYCEPHEYGVLKREPKHIERTDLDAGSTISQERAAVALPGAMSVGPHPLMRYIDAWATWANEDWAGGPWEALPSHVLGDIWARFYHAIERVDETPSTEWYAGNLLHRYIVAFLNAVLVEEHLARGYSEDVRLQSVAQTDYSFVVNLEHYLRAHQGDRVSDRYPWFDLFFRCPLWAIYLRPPRTDWAPAKENGAAWSAQVDSWCSPPGDPRTIVADARRELRAQALKVEFMVDVTDTTSVSYPNMYCIYDSVPVQGATDRG